MRVNVAIEVSDDERRRLRAAINRGGMASRMEVRVLAERLVREQIQNAPAPKVRRKPVERPLDGGLTASQVVDAIDGARDRTAASDAVCVTCGKIKAEHMGQRLHCPLSKSVKPGSRFEVSA
jgi:hypothetical protein